MSFYLLEAKIIALAPIMKIMDFSIFRKILQVQKKKKITKKKIFFFFAQNRLKNVLEQKFRVVPFFWGGGHF